MRTVLAALLLAAVGTAARADRLVPVDPLLDFVDARDARMTFFWDGEPVPATVSVSLDGGVPRTAAIGDDRRVRVSFGSVAEGRHRVETVTGGVTNRYAITARRPAERQPGRRLNNFVTEILSGPAREGEVGFTLSEAGWTFIGLSEAGGSVRCFLDGGAEPAVCVRPDEPTETMRWLEQGEHRLSVSGATGGRLVVRLVKPLKITARTFANEVTDVALGRRGYGWDFFRRHLLASFNSLTMGDSWRLRSATGRMAWGNAELARRGKMPMAATDIRPADLALRQDRERLRDWFCRAAAYRDGLALEMDENRVNAPKEETWAVADAIWEMADSGDPRPLYVDFCDLPGESLTNLTAQVSLISAILNTGRGRGMLVPEMYLGTRRTFEDMLRQEERAVAYVESLRAIIPAAPSRVIHLMSGWLTLGEWTSDSSCEADVKVLYDRYLNRLATDPVFQDVGGVGMSTLACDEEIARWVAKIVHHYCIEGAVEPLSARYGWSYAPTHLVNGDFIEGLTNWTVQAAAGGSVEHRRRPGYGGKRGQCRMARTTMASGENFALFTRSAAAPNRLSQTVRGLAVGRWYALVYALADFDDVEKPGSVEPDLDFGVELPFGTVEPSLTLEFRAPDARAAAKAKKAGKPPHCVTVTRRLVFRATAESGELVFRDWKADRPGEAGRRHVLNCVGLYPYWKEEATMIWGLMLQLGHNMWAEAPLYGEPTEAERDRYAAPRNRTDEKLWYEVTEYAARKGVNLVLVDLGEGMVYPSHQELAVEGSWSPEKMKKELARLRSLGLEPIPKLNFSTAHDAWLKEYSRMVSTPVYYKVCADVIRDVCEIFGRPRFFHVGMDEERAAAQKKDRLVIERQGDLWWHDFLFYTAEIERNGSKAWCWSDYNWVHHDQFLKRMPHTVMQSNWHYFFLQHMVRNDAEIRSRDWPEAWAGPLGFLELEEARYDQIPCASNYKQPKNLEVLVKFCKEHIARERIRGFLMAPWQRSYGEKHREKLLEACDLVENARRLWASEEKDLVIYGATPAGIAAAVEARKKGLEPILVEPSRSPAGFAERDWALVVHRGERLAAGGVEVKDGRIVSIRTESGKIFRAGEFLDCSDGEELLTAAGLRSSR